MGVCHFADSVPLAAAHEECERLERIIVKDFDQDLKGHREKLAQGHRVRKRLDELQALSKKLVRRSAAHDRLPCCHQQQPHPKKRPPSQI